MSKNPNSVNMFVIIEKLCPFNNQLTNEANILTN